MRDNMKPRTLNKICAHPKTIAFTLGACALDVVGYYSFGEAPLQAITPNWQAMLFLVAIIIPAITLLGGLLGMLAFWLPIRIICSRINGAPLKLGDQVMILSGRHKGIIAEVYEITQGQGGWELARLDLGMELKEQFRDIFEEYSLLKITQNAIHNDFTKQM